MTLRVEGMVPLLQVFDMPVSLAFYRDLLGFERVQDSGGGERCDWIWLRRGAVDLMLNTAYEADHRPPAPAAGRVAAHRDTGLFFACPDVDAAHAYFLAKGLALDPPTTTGYGMKQLYLSDPDGYVLCFQGSSKP
ncbi:VOC family protein [Dokdonella sp.]|uniref:VOC family protein n=1 Tax=Dokdonella sp. TaxID=2291710 RepID=UPI001B238E70|nr:VOC family protein [Dokdonella sp.]MBO9665149.1 VOC family protein [Dokdonella sp.]